MNRFIINIRIRILNFNKNYHISYRIQKHLLIRFTTIYLKSLKEENKNATKTIKRCT